MWSPADWAWLAGLMDVLMPAWFYGVPVLTFRAPRFDPEQAFAMMGAPRQRPPADADDAAGDAADRRSG